MDLVSLFESLDQVAQVARKIGLRRVTRWGRHLAKRALNRDLTVDFDGMPMVASVEHRGHLYGLRKGRKEPYTVELFKLDVKPGQIVFDIGAHIAQYTLLAARQVGPQGKVFAFEPDPRTLPYLQRNVQLNGFGDQVIIVPKAVSDTAGTAPFFPHDSNPGRSSLIIPKGETRLKPIITERIVMDEYLDADIAVNVIKIDVEGAELQVLSGMNQTIARGSPELTMFIECNPTALGNFGASARMLLEKLGTMGFNTMLIDEENMCLRQIEKDSFLTKTENLYCTRSR